MKTGLALLLIGGAMHARGQTAAPDLEAWLARAITNRTYQPPAEAELTRAEKLFAHTLRGDWAAPELKAGWDDLGFGFYEVAAQGERFRLVSEPPGKEFGRGWYLFRTNRDSTVALEAPHARNDIHTGTIALRLFLAGQARVLAASTITRHRADMAHLNDTFFQACTLAFAEACPTGLVVQLHGFESENHNRLKADIVASAGTRLPEPWLGAWVERLKHTTSLAVLAYPRDTRQLGALHNLQGQELHATGGCRFLHVEMTRELRDRLTRDQQLRRTVLDSLTVIESR